MSLPTQGRRDEARGGRGTTPRPPVALLCFEAPDTLLGVHVAHLAVALAGRGRPLHLITRHPFKGVGARVCNHVVGGKEKDNLVEQVEEFTRRTGNVFLSLLATEPDTAVVGHEWTSAPALALLGGRHRGSEILSLHTLQGARTDLTEPVRGKVSQMEREGVESADRLLVHGRVIAEVLFQRVPRCRSRVVRARELFPLHRFEPPLDPAAIKARRGIDPDDPLLLFAGDLEEGHGPDLLLRAMPALLCDHPQARLVLAGDGSLREPLRVYARYLLLEQAVRLVGPLSTPGLEEWFGAADLIVVPSREATAWTPVLSAWAARKPVVVTHEAARTLVEDETDAVCVYPSENSLVGGIERLLQNAELRNRLGGNGRRKVAEQFGWPALAEQVDELLTSGPVE